MQLTLLQRVFIIFIGILLPLNGFGFINPISDSKYTQPDNSWNKLEYSGFTNFENIKQDSLKKVPLDSLPNVAADSLATDTVKKKKKPFIETKIDYSCDDTIVFSLTGQKVFLTKNSYVKYGDIELKAYYIELDLEKKEALAYGIKDSTGTFIDTPEFKDGSEEFTCKELHYNFDTGKGLVKEIITEQEGGYVHSEITKKIDEKTFYMKNAKYTTCDEDHPHFYVDMTRAKMIKDEKIVSGPLYLVLEDVPLPIGLPFAAFPITSSYSSGIIMPSYGQESARGYNLKGGGYYWAINDYYDLALTGDIYANGSWGGYVESSYKKRYRYTGSVAAEYHRNTYGDEGLDDYYQTTDFAVTWSHSQDSKANPYSSFSASVDVSTSSNDANNSTSVADITDNQKQSSISYSKTWADSPFSFNASLRHSQTSTDSTISLTLPSASLTMSSIYPFRAKGKSTNLRWWDKVGLSYSSKISNKIDTTESELFNTSLAKDWSNGYSHSIPITTNFKLTNDLTLSPTLSYKGVAYTKSIRKKWNPDLYEGDGGVATDTVMGFRYAHNYSTSLSLSLSPEIYGMYEFSEKSSIKAIRHVMTPSISFSYTPEIGVDRSKYYKYYYNEKTDTEVEYSIFEGSVYGTPSGATESGSISLSLDNNVEAKVRTANDTTGNEEFEKVKIIESLKFSTSYDVFADSLNWSTLKMSGRTSLFNEKLDLSIGSTVDPYKLDSDNAKINEFGPRLTAASIDLDYSLSSDDLKGDKGKDVKKGEPKSLAKNPNYVDFDMPWSFTIDYGWTYSKPKRTKSITQTMSFTGNVSLTPKWGISLTTGYDFSDKEMTTTQFTLTRDLHCWNMSFNAIPFGTYQSYNFSISVNSSILSDLKYEKDESWQDSTY
ncbi:putative LPS assembly protein LptD [Labilibaculum sp.]|uniref:putative LPS assembly protein LptD n=1 Tax=Labilibaculum sp. TaxID=2060723 RepID=UPI0035649999